MGRHVRRRPCSRHVRFRFPLPNAVGSDLPDGGQTEEETLGRLQRVLREIMHSRGAVIVLRGAIQAEAAIITFNAKQL